jgi:hypothetical protein
MRVVFTILFLAPFVLFGQPAFTKQLDELIKDSSNSFKNFKSGFKETRITGNSPDSIFYTKSYLDGTSNNELLICKGESIFMADVADSLDEFNGKRMVDDWKFRIGAILGDDFIIEDVKNIEGSPSKYGWDFTKGNVTVNIGLFPHKKNPGLNWIGLAVSVFDDEEMETVSKND